MRVILSYVTILNEQLLVVLKQFHENVLILVIMVHLRHELQIQLFVCAFRQMPCRNSNAPWDFKTDVLISYKSYSKMELMLEQLVSLQILCRSVAVMTNAEEDGPISKIRGHLRCVQ